MNKKESYSLPATIGGFCTGADDKVTDLRKCNMQDERSTMQKMEDFSQAFSEFLRRPKTIFDIKDRLRLLVLFVVVIAILEGMLCYFENVK